MGNVVCGFFAILSTFDNAITTACWLVLVAALLDVLDGKIARLSGATSQFGIELDSLADFLSFGVAPGVIVYALTLDWLGKWGWVVPIVFITAAAYRLARYNLLAETDEKRDFMGLPVPAAALTLVSFVIFNFHLWQGLVFHELFVTMTMICAFLMISQIQYDAMPDRFATRRDRLKLVAIIVAVIAVVIERRLALFPIMAIFILFGIGRELYRIFTLSVNRIAGRSAARSVKEETVHDDY